MKVRKVHCLFEQIENWRTPDDVMEWWLSPKADKQIDGQMEMEL